MTIRVRVTGAAATSANLERLARESPARARRAVNRTIGVARQRVIRSIAAATGIPRSVIGGRKARRSGGQNVKGKGYVKQVRATRARSEGALVVLVSGVRFSRIGRQRLGRAQADRPGPVFPAVMPSGKRSLFQRSTPKKVSRHGSPGTKRRNLSIREVVVSIEPVASRAARIHMRRVSRTVYPAKIWEELQKSIKPVRS